MTPAQSARSSVAEVLAANTGDWTEVAASMPDCLERLGSVSAIASVLESLKATGGSRLDLLAPRMDAPTRLRRFFETLRRSPDGSRILGLGALMSSGSRSALLADLLTTVSGIQTAQRFLGLDLLSRRPEVGSRALAALQRFSTLGPAPDPRVGLGALAGFLGTAEMLNRCWGIDIRLPGATALMNSRLGTLRLAGIFGLLGGPIGPAGYLEGISALGTLQAFANTFRPGLGAGPAGIPLKLGGVLRRLQEAGALERLRVIGRTGRLAPNAPPLPNLDQAWAHLVARVCIARARRRFNLDMTAPGSGRSLAAMTRRLQTSGLCQSVAGVPPAGDLQAGLAGLGSLSAAPTALGATTARGRGQTAPTECAAPTDGIPEDMVGWDEGVGARFDEEVAAGLAVVSGAVAGARSAGPAGR